MNCRGKRKILKTRFGLRLGLALFVASATVCAAAAMGNDDLRFFRIATGSAAGTYFPVGASLATAISNPPGSGVCESGGSCGVPGLIAVAATSEGSVANVTNISKGLVNSGLAQADIVEAAYTGSGPYFRRGPMSDLRVIANLYPESLHLVARRGAGIKRIRDLIGKNVSLDKPGSGTRANAENVLSAYGVQLSQIKLMEIDPGFATDLITTGELDAFFLIAGYPAPAVSELARNLAVDLIPIDGPEVERIIRRHRFFARDQIPQGAYPGLEAVNTLSIGAQWVVSSRSDDSLIYEITKALWDKRNRPLLHAGHQKAAAIDLSTALLGITVPLHPGAERYYREIGLLKKPLETN